MPLELFRCRSSSSRWPASSSVGSTFERGLVSTGGGGEGYLKRELILDKLSLFFGGRGSRGGQRVKRASRTEVWSDL